MNAIAIKVEAVERILAAARARSTGGSKQRKGGAA
jgi:hypothetical protein